MAFTFTGDMGCEVWPQHDHLGRSLSARRGLPRRYKDAKSVGGDYFKAGINPKQSFIGYMLYNACGSRKTGMH